MTQLGFADLLTQADSANQQRQLDRATGHLPGTIAEALPCFRSMIERHHAAMLDADIDQAMRLRQEAYLLAKKLDPDSHGILASEDAPGCVLERETVATPGTFPLWGQAGEFIVAAAGMRVRIEMDGIFGIGSSFCLFPGFSAHVVDLDRPFLSGTGYRSFLGIHGQLEPGLTPEAFARAVIETHVRRELKGRLMAINPRYR